MSLLVQARDGIQQTDGIRVGGVVVETTDVSVLDEPTAVHDRDVVGHVGYHPKVVGEMRISPMPDSSWSSLSRVMIWA